MSLFREASSFLAFYSVETSKSFENGIKEKYTKNKIRAWEWKEGRSKESPELDPSTR